METVRIQQTTTYAGPLGLHPAGSVWACPAEEAQALIEGGYAVQVEAGELAAGEDIQEGEGQAENTAKTDAGKETKAKKGFLKAKK